jgi:alpha-tubulin suppressor-like RCC1 family protein
MRTQALLLQEAEAFAAAARSLSIGKLEGSGPMRPSTGQTAPEQRRPVIASMAAGQYHSLVVLGDGRVFAAGRNDWGQTGLPVRCHRFQAECICI